MRRELRALLEHESFGLPTDSGDTVPPDDERFTVQVVGAIECYTPTHAAGLEPALRRARL